MELLLCGPGGISFEQAAQLLECTSAQVEENYRSARQQRATVRPTPEDKVNAVPKENFPVLWRWVAAGFAFVDLIAFAIAGGQFLWSHSFLNQKLAVPVQEDLSIQEQQKQRISLEDRFYQIQPPAGFRRISHRHSALYAQDDYINMDGQSLTFIQQVSSEQITGFDPDADFEQIPFRGRSAAFYTRDGFQKIYWFHDYYAYTLSTTLPRDQALSTAKSACLALGSSNITGAKKLPLAALPFTYTPELAKENGDILVGIPGEMDEKQITAFIKKANAKKSGFLRICEFQKDGSVLFTDLETLQGRIYWTKDTRRTSDGIREEVGAEYEKASVFRDGKRAILSLEREKELPVAVIGWEGEEFL
ncbi:MAG: DUF4367 domain-containing protein [Oscillospiraceae bacterium]|nr:DUF4367 domain-containing protein [Oscillospiraceae bacterium]